MCLNETYSSVESGKHLYEIFPIRNGLVQRDYLTSLIFSFSLAYANTRIQINQGGLIINDTYHFSFILVVLRNISWKPTYYTRKGKGRNFGSGE